ILYELLTGRPPFQGATVLDTLLQVRAQEPPRPRALRPQVDRDLETICLKCLEKDPGKRYGSAEALAEDLERWLRGEPIRARRARRRERLVRWARRRPAVAALLGLLVVVSLSGVAGVVWKYREAQDARADAVRRARDADEARAEEKRRADSEA